MQIQILFGVLLIIVLIVLIRMIRKRSLEIKYSLSWLFAIAALLIVDFIPWVLEGLAKLLGVQVPSNLLFGLGFCFFMLIVFTLTVALSKLSIRNKTLVQEVAILEKRLEQLEKKAGQGISSCREEGK